MNPNSDYYAVWRKDFEAWVDVVESLERDTAQDRRTVLAYFIQQRLANVAVNITRLVKQLEDNAEVVLPAVEAMKQDLDRGF